MSDDKRQGRKCSTCLHFEARYAGGPGYCGIELPAPLEHLLWGHSSYRKVDRPDSRWCDFWVPDMSKL